MISRPMLRRLVGALSVFLISLSAGVPSVAAADKKEFRILHVMSYHSPWRWTDRQLEGFQSELKGLNVTYEVFQMDTKRNSGREQKERKGQEARALIAAWKPDLVYTSDDDAQEYLAKYYVNQPLPFVFSGVNNDPAGYGFVGSTNITGVMEEEHFVQSVELVRKLVPGARRLALVFDDAKMWDPVRERIAKAMPKLPGVKLVANDTILTFAEYKRKIREYQGSADMIGTIGIFNLKDEDGRNVPYQEVQKWTVENSRLPDFAFWIDRVHFGTLCAVTVSEREQGRAAGRIARGILTEGRKAASYPMVPTTKGAPAISLARAKALGIRVNSDLLLTTEVIQRFDWDPP